jgi:hypothetical protein
LVAVFLTGGNIVELISSVFGIERARRKVIWLVLSVNILLIVLTMVNGHPNIWSDFDKEKNAWTFGNSMNMFLVSVVAYINYLVISERRNSVRSKSAWIWLFIAMAFIVFSSDDWLMLHERGGHAIEDHITALNRQNITFYMDDILEFSYTALGALFGIFLFRKIAQDRSAFKLYMYGIAFIFLATLIGFHPSVKSIPFPLAVIQILQMVSVFLFFLAVLNCLTAELLAIVDLRSGERSTQSKLTESMSTTTEQG